jgi:hypothetical protein
MAVKMKVIDSAEESDRTIFQESHPHTLRGEEGAGIPDLPQNISKIAPG